MDGGQIEWGNRKTRKKDEKKNQNKGTSRLISGSCLLLQQGLLLSMLSYLLFENREIARKLDIAILRPSVEGPLTHVNAALQRKLEM